MEGKRGKRIVTGINDLQTLHPEIAKEWDYEKNGELLPTQIGVCDKRVFWKCENGHSWQRTIYTRVRSKTHCPICADKVFTFVDGKNNLNIVFPDILKEWDYEKNVNISPETVAAKSCKKAYWICSKNKNHKWQATIASRTVSGTGCPECARENRRKK